MYQVCVDPGRVQQSVSRRLETVDGAYKLEKFIPHRPEARIRLRRRWFGEQDEFSYMRFLGEPDSLTTP